MRKPAAFFSVAIHVGAVLLLFSVSLQRRPVQTPSPNLVRILAPFHPPRLRAAEGGGGQKDPLPPRRGQAPPRFTHKVWTPRMEVRNENRKLVIEQALLETPEFNIHAPVTGDPLSSFGLPSGGPGGPNGIGAGPGPSIGPGSNQGGNMAGSVSRITRAPQVLYMEEPEYSEEARKARFQGTVILAIEVDTAGRATNIRVVRSLGMGLDERAVAAVRRWRFRPAVSGDRPVGAPATVEVSFHLL